MQIDDTYLVVGTAECPEFESGKEKEHGEFLRQSIMQLTRNATATVQQQRPQHRTFALSVMPLLTGRTLAVTVIVALVPNPLAQFNAAPSPLLPKA